MSKPVSDLEHIESLFSDLPNYVFYKDDHCVYRLCNQAFAQFAGFQSVQEVIGKTDFDMPWERQHAELYQQEDVWIMQTGESIIEREVPMRIAHEDRILLISKRGVKNASHHIMGILGIYIDITDRKAAETLRIHNTKLLYRLAQQIGHDLRSPLTALGMMLARQAIPDAQKENMQQCLEQMNVLTSHLLKDFSVPQAPQETYFPILIAVQHILQQKHHQYDPKKIAWRFETDLEQTAFLFLHGNALSFQRMCGNLINNSVDALDGHSGVVTLRLEANQKHIRLQIQDTGKGIEPEVLEKIQNRIQVTSGKIEGHGIAWDKFKIL